MVEADRVNASIQHLWTIFDRLLLQGVQAESSKALRTSNHAIRNSLLIYIASAIVTGILMFIFLPQSYPLALSGLVVAFLFVAVALLIYQIEYMTMYVTVQLLSAAHLVLLFISFMIPAQRDRLPAHHRGRDSARLRMLPRLPSGVGCTRVLPLLASSLAW